MAFVLCCRLRVEHFDLCIEDYLGVAQLSLVCEVLFMQKFLQNYSGYPCILLFFIFKVVNTIAPINSNNTHFATKHRSGVFYLALKYSIKFKFILSFLHALYIQSARHVGTSIIIISNYNKLSNFFHLRLPNFFFIIFK